MKRRIGNIISCALALAAASPLAAADWSREVAGWDVGRSGDTCAMVMEYEGEGSTRLGLVIKDDAAKTYLAVTNFRWSTKENEAYELKFHLGKWVYTMPSIGIAQDLIRRGFLTRAGKDFVADFAKASALTITRDETLVDDLSLEGSGAALVVLERCRRELARDLEHQRRDRERLEHIPVDPFASKPTKE